MHTKSNNKLKTMHKIHNNKHTNCPAQLILTLLPSATKLMDFVCLYFQNTIITIWYRWLML